MRSGPPNAPRPPSIPKAPSGIQGLDEITGGGLPRGRPTLVCGSAGCGKTLLAMEFLVRGATEHGEPGVFLAFEETGEELAQNVRSLGFDLEDLAERGKLLVDHVHVERSQIEVAGEYDLEALFIRLGHAIDSIGAKRVVLDTIEALFGGLSDTHLLRAELRRLFRWLKDKGLTAIITAERGEGSLTRHGLEEYVSDCVILLDHRVVEGRSTRHLRVVKYRGTTHGTNEYPFLIDETGISVLPITSLGLEHASSDERVSTGIPRLDAMLGGAGLYRGSSVLISGTAGTGKTSLAVTIADATCRRGERCLYLSYEESASQLARNMRSIGIDLSPWIEQDLLRVISTRPTAFGLEMHLVAIHKLVEELRPSTVVVDPITSFLGSGGSIETEAMLMRLVDYLKGRQVTGVLTSLTHDPRALEQSQVGVSSLVDTWILLRDLEVAGERNRALHVLKSRGMAHSSQVRELLLTDDGVDLQDVYIGPDGILTGALRRAQERREEQAARLRQRDLERRKRDLERKRLALDAQIAAQRAEVEAEQEELELLMAQQETGEGPQGPKPRPAGKGRARPAEEPPRASEGRSRTITPHQGQR